MQCSNTHPALVCLHAPGGWQARPCVCALPTSTGVNWCHASSVAPASKRRRYNNKMLPGNLSSARCT
eukprot:8194766-Pyramimonas_sp.AAC.2